MLIGHSDKFNKTLEICWFITLISSFFGIMLFPIEVGGLGTFYLFRFSVIITGILFCIKVVLSKFKIISTQTQLIKAVYLLFACMILYSIYSLFIAQNFSHTLSKSFNLCLDILFCFLAINMIPKNFRLNINIIIAALIVIQLLAIYETIFGGIASNSYEGLERYNFLGVLILGRPVLGFGNTNNLVSAIAMITIILTWTLVINCKALTTNKKYIVPIIVVFINSATYYLARCALSQLTVTAMTIQLVLIIIYTIISNRKFVVVAVCIALLFAFTNLMPYAVRYSVIIENSIRIVVATITDTEPILKELPAVYGDDVSLSDQFHMDASGGVRTTLILHGFETIANSYGLGVGVGNTEVMAAQENIIPIWEGNEAYSLHCFPLRILADMGIFLFAPLMLVLYFVVKQGVYYLKRSTHNKKDKAVAVIVFCGTIMQYVFLSTVSSDAQDLLPMWLFVAIIVTIMNKIYEQQTL